jgi:glutathione S-transferase
MLALYGHPFSSYTWKALIALYAHDLAFDFRVVDGDHPDNARFVRSAGPAGKFPVIEDGDATVFEATSIIEWLALNHGAKDLIPADPAPALRVRMLDRVFDNYVMNVMQLGVNEYLRDAENPDQTRLAEVRDQLTRTYAWLEDWLADWLAIPGTLDRVTLVECAAAPSLFYADWVHPIAEQFPRLQRWRAHLLALPPVKRCVDEARPYRQYFPLGAPDRD